MLLIYLVFARSKTSNILGMLFVQLFVVIFLLLNSLSNFVFPHATQSLVDNEFNQVVKEKFGVDLANRDFLIALGAVDPIDVVMDSYQGEVARLFNAGQAKEAVAFVQTKVNEVTKDLASRQASLASGPLAQQVSSAQAKIKALTGIDVKTTKDFSIVRSKLQEEKLVVERKHGLREKATQVNLLRRKFVGLQEHRGGFPWFFQGWLKRTITVGLCIGLVFGGMWEYKVRQGIKQKEDYYKQLYKKHPEYVTGLAPREN